MLLRTFQRIVTKVILYEHLGTALILLVSNTILFSASVELNEDIYLAFKRMLNRPGDILLAGWTNVIHFSADTWFFF